MATRLRLFPLNAVLFPGATLNLHVFEPRYKQMIAECLDTGERFGVALIAEGTEAGDPNVTSHTIGTVAEILEVVPLPFERYYVAAVGRERFRIIQVTGRDPYLTADVELLEEDVVIDEGLALLDGRVRGLFIEYAELLTQFTGHVTDTHLPDDAEHASYTVGDALQVAERVKQRLLEEDATLARLEMECSFLERALPQMRRLCERRDAQLKARAERGEDLSYRPGQEKFFGKFFSAN